VMMCYRPEYYGIMQAKTVDATGLASVKSMEGVGYIFVRKQRNGPVGDVELRWNKHSVIYENPKTEQGGW